MKNRDIRDWQSIIRQWQASGQTPAAFCQEHKIPKSSFWAWRSRLVGEPAIITAKAKETFVEVSPVLEPSHQARVLRITTAHGCQIEVPL